MKEEAIFFEASQRSGQDRGAYLDEACGTDAGLRQRMQKMLDAFDRPDDFLQVPLEEATTALPRPTSEKAGTLIAGRYKLVEEIGEGGMGTVWVAQQTEPVKRIVAVKLIKAGMDSKAMLARFESERQALALMDHPNIARVLDGGATADGRPFFVMELVKGVPITQFCDARKLTPQQRLELFVPVCQAIQHAHQKGVIHRDIKPSNVLIALYDDKPVPKVIDFGVAKAAGQMLTDKSLMTGFGAVIGTPEYMSPEQASLNNLDIDTRSDVYSLGVLLYELLAGSPPFQGDELKRAGMFEMLRIVCEEEPPRPSIKLSTANKLASISADRGTEPKKLTGLLRNELDWIVMKALEKDRARRYETVNGFAADIQRYLSGEAVQAHPPSAVYRLRKFARKHRAGLTTATAFVVLMIAAALVSSWLAFKAVHAEGIADERRIEAEANAKEARDYSEAFSQAFGKIVEANVTAEIVAIGLQIELDLGKLKADPRVGLLRLARPLKDVLEFKFEAPWSAPGTGTMRVAYSNIPPFPVLREFTTAAVLAAGQRFATLATPITVDKSQIISSSLDSGARRILTLEKNDTARLWDAHTGRPIALLRRGNERVLDCGFSSDGTILHTDSPDGTVRLWNANDGTFRAETEPRPERIQSNGALTAARCAGKVYSSIVKDRLLTWSITVGAKPEPTFGIGDEDKLRGPVELWDARTGKFIARLSPALEPGHVQFMGNDKYITSVEGKSTLTILSADDGRLLENLSHPAGESISGYYTSPNGQRIVTVCETSKNKSHFRIWERQPKWTSPAIFTTDDGQFGAFLSDDVVLLTSTMLGHGRALVFSKDTSQPKTLSLPGPGDETNVAFYSWPLYGVSGHYLRIGDCRLIDLLTGNLLSPPKGRRYHPALADFAPDGRFVVGGQSLGYSLIDTQTEKEIDLRVGNSSTTALFVNSPTGRHWVMPSIEVNNSVFKLLPPAEQLAIAPELLELWAQVAVRGELNSAGQLVKWDEPTWEKKRQELAAKPAPIPDFPFPGYVATDKLHWLRAEFDDAKTDAEKLRLAKELLRQAELFGERAEAVRWKEEVKKLTAPAPTVKPQ